MRIELMTIGDELLTGKTLNGNCAWIGKKLLEEGYDLQRQTALPDEKKALTENLSRALLHADLVITTGGLGPTGDDLTKQIASALFSSPLVYREEVAEEIKSRFGQIPSLQEQATLPSKALVLKNPLGTAYGLIFSENQKTLILLPGVPLEMQAIFVESVIPFLKKHFKSQALYCKTLHFSILYESLVDPLLRKLQDTFKEVTFGIYPEYGFLSVVLRSRSLEQIEAAEKEFDQEFGIYRFFAKKGQIQEAVQKWFVDSKKTLACAESCTGGMLASLITEISGSSEYFLGSIVSYSNAWKEKLLHVDAQTLKTQGAVSEEVVLQMLKGLFAISSADYGIAVSGIAGPTGGSKEKPVGTIWVALGKRGDKPDVGQFLIKGDRQTRILRAAHILLGLLLRKVTHGVPCFPLYPEEEVKR